MAGNRYAYYPMHMHLHAACDHGASMALHMHNAQQLGMRYIRFTDHDTRTGEKKHHVYGYSFHTPELSRQEPCGLSSGFRPKDDRIAWQINPEDHQLDLRFQSEDTPLWQGSGITFFSDGTRHTSPLAAGVTLEPELMTRTPSPDTRLIFDVTLSQRPPECVKAHMLYVLGSTEGLEGPHTQVIPLDRPSGKLILALSEEVSEDPAIGGLDNAFETVTFRLEARNGAAAEAIFGDFRIRVKKHYEQAHRALMETAAWAGERYGVTPFVTFEISGAGCHKNCYGTQVPTIDYRAAGYAVTEQEAADHVKAHGGIFAFNHPFAIAQLKRKTFTDVERMRILSAMQAELTARSALGADLIEVGFPEGRGFPQEDYLLLWDTLTLSGLLLTGYGSSDSHRDNTGWFSGNNFAAWVGVPQELPHPIPEEIFNDAMKKGRLYTGDPVKLRGSIDFRTEAGHPMGSLFLSDQQEEVPLLFTAEETQPGWQFRLIENGQAIHTETLPGGNFTHRSLLAPSHHAINFQRAELWDETGRCVLLTNPIYLINTSIFTGDIPVHRIRKEETT